MTVKISVSISDQQAGYARKQVANGRASSTSAVIRQAHEAKRREDKRYEAEMIRRIDGPHVDMPTFQKMSDEMLSEERARLGLAD